MKRRTEGPILNPFDFGLAGGLVAGSLVAIATYLPLVFGSAYGALLLNLFLDIFPGYDASSLMGVVIGFIDAGLMAFLALYAFAALYNHLEKRE